MYSLEESQIAIEQSRILNINSDIDQLQHIVTESLDSTRYIDKIENIISSNNEIPNISTESINLSLNIIYENLGAKKYSFSMENYNINNSFIALENLNDFIKKLWVKVKATIGNLWEKVNDFWSNHFSSLNKIKLSLSSILLRIEHEYNLTEEKEPKEQDYHVYLHFNMLQDIHDKTIEQFINTHNNNFNELNELIKYTKHFNHHVKTINESEFERGIDYLLQGLSKDFIRHPFRFGEEKYPIVNGEYITIDYKYNEEEHDIDIINEKEKVDNNINDHKVYLISKHKLKNIIRKTIEIIDETIKYKGIQESIQNEFKEVIKIYDKIIEDGEPTLKNDHKKVIRLIYRINGSIPGLFGIVVLSNVKLARAITHYAEYCLREQ